MLSSLIKGERMSTMHHTQQPQKDTHIHTQQSAIRQAYGIISSMATFRSAISDDCITHAIREVHDDARMTACCRIVDRLMHDDCRAAVSAVVDRLTADVCVNGDGEDDGGMLAVLAECVVGDVWGVLRKEAMYRVVSEAVSVVFRAAMGEEEQSECKEIREQAGRERERYKSHPLFGWLEILGKRSIHLTMNKKRIKRVRVHYDMIDTIEAIFCDYSENLARKTFKDLRDIVGELLPQNYIFLCSKQRGRVSLVFDEPKTLLFSGCESYSIISINTATYAPRLDNMIEILPFLADQNLLLLKYHFSPIIFIYFCTPETDKIRHSSSAFYNLLCNLSDSDYYIQFIEVERSALLQFDISPMYYTPLHPSITHIHRDTLHTRIRLRPPTYTHTHTHTQTHTQTLAYMTDIDTCHVSSIKPSCICISYDRHMIEAADIIRDTISMGEVSYSKICDVNDDSDSDDGSVSDNDGDSHFDGRYRGNDDIYDVCGVNRCGENVNGIFSDMRDSSSHGGVEKNMAVYQLNDIVLNND